MTDLISNASTTPAYDDIRAYINSPVQELWMELNDYVQEQFKSKPKIQYSTCAGKPGWNVKYQKSGKSICTLYPEQNCFTALVVIKQYLAPLIETTSPEFHPLIQNLVKNSKPFNHTLWLMIPIADRPVLESVLDLLQFKMSIQK
jgi:hypothetical protein